MKTIPVTCEPSTYEAEIQPYIDGGIIQYAMKWQPSIYTKLDELQNVLIDINNRVDQTMELCEELLKITEKL